MNKLNELLNKDYVVTFQKGFKGEYFIILNSAVGCPVKAKDIEFKDDTLDGVLSKAAEFVETGIKEYEDIKNDAVTSKYLDFKIPLEKVKIEVNRKGSFMGFPFFLKKVDNKEIQTVTLNEYPEAHKNIVWIRPNGNLPKHADQSEDFKITDEIIDELLIQGFKWYHESEMDTMW